MKLPPLVSCDVSKIDEAVFFIEVLPELDAFRGHFPDNPILPGVVQMDWVMQLAVSHLGIAEPAANKFQIKFRKIISPNMPLSLALKIDRAKRQLSFTYMSGDDIMSSGQVKLGVV